MSGRIYGTAAAVINSMLIIPLLILLHAANTPPVLLNRLRHCHITHSYLLSGDDPLSCAFLDFYSL